MEPYFDVTITGCGTRQEIIDSLQIIIDTLKVTDTDMDYEDATLTAEIEEFEFGEETLTEAE